MKFRSWLSDHGSPGLASPTLGSDVNNTDGAVASGEVQRTGLQPQVDSQEIRTKQKDQQDKIQAINGALKRLDSELPQGNLEDMPAVKNFRSLFDKLVKQWQAQSSAPQN